MINRLIPGKHLAAESLRVGRALLATTLLVGLVAMPASSAVIQRFRGEVVVGKLSYFGTTGVLAVPSPVAGGVMYSGAANIATSAAGSSGQVLRSGGTGAPTWSTATYPATAGTAGKVLISDGTNIVSSTPTYPNAAPAAGKFLRGDGTNFLASTATLADTYAAGTLLHATATDTVSGLADAAVGNVLISGGAGVVPSYGKVTGAHQVAASSTRSMTAEIENLAANADIGTRAFFRVPFACTVTGAHLVNKETASTGVDGTNTLVALLANATGAATIATLTQTTNLSANTATSLGTLTNTAIAAGDLLTIAITNGTNADPGPMVVQVLCTVD